MTNPTETRATSIVDLRDRMKNFRSAEATQRGLGIEVRPSDVFISTYPKCGTTWTQQIVHQLRTGGSMDFDEICVVVPWLESAWDMNIDPDSDQEWTPRAFKSHLDWERIPKGGRYIHVVRDPLTTVASFHRFFEGYVMAPGAITLDDFVIEWLLDGTASGRLWDFIVSWWRRIDDPSVLIMAYEDMVADLPWAVEKIARHLGLAQQDRIDAAIVRSSRDFMSSHATQFDDHAFRVAANHRIGIPPGGSSAKVQTTPSAAVLSGPVRAALDEAWVDTVTSALGIASYDDLRRRLSARR